MEYGAMEYWSNQDIRLSTPVLQYNFFPPYKSRFLIIGVKHAQNLLCSYLLIVVRFLPIWPGCVD